MLQICHNNFGRLRVDFPCFFEIRLPSIFQAGPSGLVPGHNWDRELR
jgi:hypothetical protein